MSQIEKWIAGTVGLSWATIMSTELNSIASGNAIAATSALDNSSNLDMFADFSIHLASLAGASPNFVALLLFPLQGDGSTYGDGRFGSSASLSAAAVPLVYWRGNFSMLAATQAQEGMIEGVLIPRGSFKPVLWNQMGAAFASSGNTLKWRTYNRVSV